MKCAKALLAWAVLKKREIGANRLNTERYMVENRVRRGGEDDEPVKEGRRLVDEATRRARQDTLYAFAATVRAL